MKYIAICFAFLMLEGCVSTIKTSLKLPYSDQAPALQLVDKRPKGQSDQAIMSLNLSNCQYGSYQIGESNESPNRIKVLENYLSKRVGDKFESKTANVVNFVIHVNAAARLKGGLSKTYGDNFLADTIIQKEVIGCSNDDLYGGYSIGELTDEFSPLIAIVDLEIDGKVYHGRAVKSLEGKDWGPKNPKWDSLMQGVILQAGDDLIRSIKDGQFTTAD
ncbi:MAG: hypothetical protein P8171_25520 [Candidatus Thiodiazotropha sp.]|jgi:hypothetical protein